MNNFEIISRVLSQDNADINKLKTETKKLKTETTKLKAKEDGFIKLNTDALAGQRFGSETPINLEQNIVLDLFNARSTEELYSQIRGFDNKTFVLKPNGNSFTVDSIQYTITACNPCIGKIYDYNSIPTLCLTFLIDTFNSQTALFKFFISANSNTEISGKLTVENFNKEFEAKQDALVSGTNIKTINGNSIVGSGDITLQDTLVSGTNIKTINGKSVIGSGDITLQDTLVSGTNIKTINGNSIVGSGDMIISGYPVVIHGANDTTFTLTPNTFHIWGQVPSLTLNFGSKIRGVSNEYLFQFISGQTATSLTLPGNITWANNNVPIIKPNMIYQVSILRRLASILEFSSDKYFDSSNYLTIEALEDNLTVTFTNDIEYAIDSTEWVKLTAGDETPPIDFGQTLSFRGNLTPNLGIGKFTISKKCNLTGNCMSMLFGDNAANNYSLSGKAYAFRNLFYNCSNIVNVDSSFLPATTLANQCYASMFDGCSSLTTAPALPATTLTERCYDSMFQDCASLTTAPALPATTLAEYCYYNMFRSCTSLTTAPALHATSLAKYCCELMFSGCKSLTHAPELQATTLANACYRRMFSHCSSLTTAPELPATTLANGCYSFMFEDCSSLTTAPKLPATTLTGSCYYNMFANCTSLTTAPELPATTLADSCYKEMFYYCKSLVNAPELPVTTLADSCYSGMFFGCTSLTTAPELPATTLVDSCYDYMFIDCKSLTTAPALPATTLASDCYNSMFYGCSKLNYIKMLATDISATNCLNDWVNGVSSTGTFVKNAAMESLPTGSSGIPSGWTVQNA